MSEENEPEVNEDETEVVETPMSLTERLERCKSRKAARETIADYCNDHGHDIKKFVLTSEHNFILQSLR